MDGSCKGSRIIRRRKKEEGYSLLDISANYCEKISKFKKGDLLDTGNEELLGGVKYEYNKGAVLLPYGSKEPVSYDYRMDFDAVNLVYAITARSGWEWLNSVRNEDRFKEYIERAKKLADKY